MMLRSGGIVVFPECQVCTWVSSFMWRLPDRAGVSAAGNSGPRGRAAMPATITGCRGGATADSHPDDDPEKSAGLRQAHRAVAAA